MRSLTGSSLLTALLLHHGESASTLRIMPMGDALTTGFSGAPGGYRPRLYSKLTNNGYTIDFVGSEVAGKASTLPDRDCEAHNDFTIADMTDYVDEFLDAHDPDVILLMMGQKDLVLTDVDFTDAADRYNVLITKISSSRPESHIFVANLPPRKNSDQNDMVNEFFNPRIPDIVAAHENAGRHVTFVDVNSVVSESDLATAFQPTEDGYNAIGNAFGNAITALIDENLSGLTRGIVRVEGGLDRRSIKITFSKPIPQRRTDIDNFFINNNLNILSSSLENDDRVVVLTTSEQTPGATYKVIALAGVPGTSEMKFTVGFRILSLSDWHNGEKYVFGGKDGQVDADIAIIQHLKSNYFGELIMIPGDTNAGFWDTDSFAMEMSEFVGHNLSREDVVLTAGDRCYGGLLSSFRFGGYPNVIVAIGDHELGDNSWDVNSLKSLLQPQFRQAFTSNFNNDYDGNFKYTSQIGNAPSRPIGTSYENSSYAYIHRNTLIVTVDVLHQESPFSIIGTLGTVTGAVTGSHLQWLDNVLEQGTNLSEVKHIIVQGHFPALFPVRKTKSSGIYMDNNDESEFWQVLRKHPVDIYFAGEAHLNTASIDPESDIIQVVGRGNFFTNFFTVDISNDTIDITCYDETGPEKTMENFNYEANGHLSISKLNGSKSISASGELAFFDADDPVLYFNFESIAMLVDRPVLGLGEMSGVRRAPIIDSIIVDGSECSEALINSGTFGQDYDAQSTNVELTTGVYGGAGLFSTDSRAAIFGMGPHSESRPISYSMWFKTTAFGARTLLAYEGFWNQDAVMSLRLQNGEPELVFSSGQKIYNNSIKLNDGLWHHIAATMPFKGCKMSDVKFFVNGKLVSMSIAGPDNIIDLPNGAMLSLGGFGYGGASSSDALQRTGFRQGLNFYGAFDDVLVFARPLKDSEIRELATHPVSFALRSKISYKQQEALCLGLGLFGDAVVLRNCNDQDGQQWIQDILGYIHNKDRYEKCLIPELEGSGIYSVKVGDCNDAIDSVFAWNLEIGYAWHENTGKMLAVDTDNSNQIVLSEEQFTARALTESEWDIVYEGGFPPSYLTGEPSLSPTRAPSSAPSASPSDVPTTMPSSSPTSNPSASPTDLPSMNPSSDPSSSPSQTPTGKPSNEPSGYPSVSPSSNPSSEPSSKPTGLPSAAPSNSPTTNPTSSPSNSPSSKPSHSPTLHPTTSEAPTACADGWGKVTIENGKERSCFNAANNSNLCKSEAISDHCPVTCDSCHLSGTAVWPTQAPISETAAPTRASNPDTCADFAGEFPLPNGNMKTCENALNRPILCDISIVIDKCPVTCGICAGCKDSTDVLIMPSGTERTCTDAVDRPALCGKDIFIQECPVSCNLCGEDNSSGGSDPQTCEDNFEQVILPNGNGKSCFNAKNNLSLCDKWVEVAEHCPLTCGKCDLQGGDLTACEDNNGKTTLPNGLRKSCFNAKNNLSLCDKWVEVAEHCPLTCGKCDLQGDSIECEDSNGKTTLPNGLGKSCKQAQNNSSLCGKWKEIRDFCPVTCNSC